MYAFDKFLWPTVSVKRKQSILFFDVKINVFTLYFLLPPIPILKTEENHIFEKGWS